MTDCLDVEAFVRFCREHPGQPAVGELDLSEFHIRDSGSALPPLVTGTGAASLSSMLRVFESWLGQALVVGLWSDGEIHFWMTKPNK